MPTVALPRDTQAAPELAGDRIGADVAAAVLGVTPHEVRGLCRKRLIPFWRIGRRLRFSRRALEQFVADGGTASCPTDIAA